MLQNARYRPIRRIDCYSKRKWNKVCQMKKARGERRALPLRAIRMGRMTVHRMPINHLPPQISRPVLVHTLIPDIVL